MEVYAQSALSRIDVDRASRAGRNNPPSAGGAQRIGEEFRRKPSIGVLDWLRPVHLPRQSEIAIDGVVMVWTAGLTMVSSIAFGLVPALMFTHDKDRQPLLSSRSGSPLLRSRRLHRGLVVAEVALSIVPLIAAGLMLRTFTNLLQAPFGFDPEHV